MRSKEREEGRVRLGDGERKRDLGKKGTGKGEGEQTLVSLQLVFLLVSVGEFIDILYRHIIFSYSSQSGTSVLNKYCSLSGDSITPIMYKSTKYTKDVSCNSCHAVISSNSSYYVSLCYSCYKESMFSTNS